MHKYRITFKPKTDHMAYFGCSSLTTTRAPIVVEAYYVEFSDRFVQFTDEDSRLLRAYDSSDIESVVEVSDDEGVGAATVQGDPSGGCTFKVTVSQ